MRMNEADESSTLGSGTSIHGRITGNSHLTVDGTIDGTIAILGDLIISPGAQIKGSVEAVGVSVEGNLEGEVVATGCVHATAGSTLRGNVKSEAFSMEEGANVAATIAAEFDLPEELREGRR
ncbi:MAG: polymer-forming cytoskeletal protein [Polyangiaceae bacterium]|nr:polymer-forming cytoskeletal protein [Polyangiaceae bacterium]